MIGSQRVSVAAIALLGFIYVTYVDGFRGYRCIERDYGQDSFVCVCNATYCDTILPLERQETGRYVVYTSSRNGLRLHRYSQSFPEPGENGRAPNREGTITFRVDRSREYQSVIGFGGAMTDAAAINMASLPDEARNLLIKSYFSEEGIEYNMIRMPIGGCDFSTRPYSYDDKGQPNDTTLSQFQLQDEDISLKIPFVKEAIGMSPNKIQLLGSAWSAPKWMKTNNDFIGRGQLKEEYYQLWADYHVKFLDEYGKQGLKFWGLTTQNEPMDGMIPDFTFNCMGWTADTQRKWIVDNLGPTLHSKGYKDLEVLIMDDQRIALPSWPAKVFADEKADKYASGIAVHWYMDYVVPPEALDMTHNNHPSKFLLYTEACNADKANEHLVLLGNWERGEKYAHSIIETMNHWVTGWIDWNLALDLSGGPNWAENVVDAAIIVNASASEFYKQPTYYTLGHFTKFVPRGSVRIGLDVEETFRSRANNGGNDEQTESSTSPKIDSIAFKTPDGATVLVLLNREHKDHPVVISDPERGEINKVIMSQSIVTVIYW